MNLLFDLLTTLRVKTVVASIAIGLLCSLLAYELSSSAGYRAAFAALAYVVGFAVSLTVLQIRQKD
jgi:hypothetical protein